MESERTRASTAMIGLALVDLLVVIAALTIVFLIFVSLRDRLRFWSGRARLLVQTINLLNNPSATRADCDALNDNIRAFNEEFADLFRAGAARRLLTLRVSSGPVRQPSRSEGIPPDLALPPSFSRPAFDDRFISATLVGQYAALATAGGSRIVLEEAHYPADRAL